MDLIQRLKALSLQPAFVLILLVVSAVINISALLMMKRYEMDFQYLLNGGIWVPPAYAATLVPRTMQVICFITLFFLFSLWFLSKLEAAGAVNRWVKGALFLSLIVQGLFFANLGPLFSHDMYYYAGQGRVLATHQDNPYHHVLREYEKTDPVIAAIPGP